MTFREFCSCIRTLQKRFGFSVTSWFRSPKRNKAKGGMSTSKHLKGLAVDAVLDNMQDTNAKAELTAAARAMGLGVVDEGDHLHIQVKKESADEAT